MNQKEKILENKQYTKNPLVGLLVDDKGNYIFEERIILKIEEDILGNKVLIREKIFLET